MGFRHTLACAAAVLTLSGASGGPAFSDDTATPSADRYTSGDLMAESSRDRRIWVRAFMVGTANAVALRDVESGRCLSRWYANDEEQVFRNIERSMSAFPESRPAEVIFALARRACPDFVPGS